MPGSKPPLIELRGIGRAYSSIGTRARSGRTTRALSEVSLRIDSGEFVSITGPSGSGKSTLMNILGCLDRPTEGIYELRGQDIGGLDPDELARLRRESFGFIFQSYNLLGSATARENVELPATYAGLEQTLRSQRAEALLKGLGLGNRLLHRPSALSGGEQQRVAVARALMNGGEVILADEPTGALDSGSGEEVLGVLHDLASLGHTVIIVTHDAKVAAWAERNIHLLDGCLVADHATAAKDLRSDRRLIAKGSVATDERGHAPDFKVARLEAITAKSHGEGANTAISARGMLVALQGWTASLAANLLRGKRLRTALTALSVTMGVWSVVVMLSVVEGAYQRGVEVLSRAGADEISVSSRRSSWATSTTSAGLTLADANAIFQEVGGLRAVLPRIVGLETLQRGDLWMEQLVHGVASDVPVHREWELERGRFFDEQDSATLQPVAVIGASIRDDFFLPTEDPVGDYLLMGGMPFLVKGVLSRFAPPGASTIDYRDRQVLVPMGTAQTLLFNREHLESITILAQDPKQIREVLRAVENLLARRHGYLGVRVQSNLSAQIGFTNVERLLSTLTGALGAISLLIGGAGVASMMLVSLSERSREIGIRMAVGARHRDILRQFLSEAVAITFAGGILGTILGFASGFLLGILEVAVRFSAWFVLAALGCTLMTGLVAGIVPARRAARLNPVAALSASRT